MITSEQCQTYLTECEAMGTSSGISIQRATAIMGICHALIRSHISSTGTIE